MTRDVPGMPAANVGNEAAPRAPLDASEGVRVIRVGSNQPADPPAVRPEEYVEGTHLRYFDASNVEWSVVEVEVDRKKVPSARGARCLLFSRKDCIRRVWNYPADWRLLDPAALAAVSLNR